MKTGNKIAWIYTLLMMGLVVAVSLAFYFVTAHLINKVYDSYLAERAILTAQKYWEKDELDDFSYNQVQKKYDQTLPVDKEIIINADSVNEARKNLSKFLTPEDIDELYKSHIVHFSGKDYQRGVALYYPDNEGNFIIIIHSSNKYGADIVSTMGWLLIGAFVITFVLMYGVGKLYAIRLVNKIDEAYHSEKSFIRNASHELNNPLTAIQGECEITLLRERTANEYQLSLKRIENETHRIITLMKHLLFLSHGDREMINSVVESINISSLVKEFSDESVVVITDGEEFVINANANLLKIALKNIVNNACKYSKGEKVYIRARKNTIVIEDSGIGIPEKDLNYITQPFYRAKNARGFEGYGVGLSLSIRILKYYGAKLKIESKEGVGTLVQVSF